jgi:ABC-type nitrate/sulfonate/bicarbonate transport system substrate-binding protein
MGGDEVRFPALQTKAIQATLFNSAMSIKAQRDGFTKLAAASDYANLIEGGIASSNEKIKQNPEKTFRFIRASLKGLNYYVSKREPAIKYMMEALRLKDHELANLI